MKTMTLAVILALAGTSAWANDVLVVDSAGTRTEYQGELTGVEALGPVGHAQFLATDASTAPLGASFGAGKYAPIGAWSLRVQTAAGDVLYPDCQLASIAMLGESANWRFVCQEDAP